MLCFCTMSYSQGLVLESHNSKQASKKCDTINLDLLYVSRGTLRYSLDTVVNDEIQGNYYVLDINERKDFRLLSVIHTDPFYSIRDSVFFGNKKTYRYDTSYNNMIYCVLAESAEDIDILASVSKGDSVYMEIAPFYILVPYKYNPDTIIYGEHHLAQTIDGEECFVVIKNNKSMKICEPQLHLRLYRIMNREPVLHKRLYQIQKEK